MQPFYCLLSDFEHILQTDVTNNSKTKIAKPEVEINIQDAGSSLVEECTCFSIERALTVQNQQILRGKRQGHSNTVVIGHRCSIAAKISSESD